jgi:phosphomannomutase
VTQRILSISGLRGIVGDGLDPVYVTQFALALGTLAGGGSVVVARDGRSTGQMLKHAVIAGLTAAGCRVLDAGIASTPTCGVLVRDRKAAAGLQITASHNPVEWNGLKPFSAAGSVFDEALGRRLIGLLETQSFALSRWDRIGTVEELPDPSAPHWNRVLQCVAAAAIRARKPRVVLDCNHGSGSVLGPRLLESLGCEVTVLGGTPDGLFEHSPEPLKENLTGLCDAVREHGADVGFAQDPDADRLAIVDNTGRYIGEELTLALCVDHILSRTSEPGPVVVNGSTSRVTADIAAKYGREFHRSYVGEAHVVAKMKAVGAILGGEGNGGVIEPKVGYVRDSFIGMAYVLEGLAQRGGELSGWVDVLPRYTIVKDKLTCPRERVDAACTALRKAFADATATEGDGLRLDWPDRWVQVRASNTERYSHHRRSPRQSARPRPVRPSGRDRAERGGRLRANATAFADLLAECESR